MALPIELESMNSSSRMKIFPAMPVILVHLYRHQSVIRVMKVFTAEIIHLICRHEAITRDGKIRSGWIEESCKAFFVTGYCQKEIFVVHFGIDDPYFF